MRRDRIVYDGAILGETATTICRSGHGSDGTGSPPAWRAGNQLTRSPAGDASGGDTGWRRRPTSSTSPKPRFATKKYVG